MKTYTILFALLVSTIILITVAANSKVYLPQESELKWMKFKWVEDSLGGQYFDKAYIHLPVNFQGIPHDFTLQFDLGSDVTQIYEPSIKPYLKVYPQVGQTLDTVSEFRVLKPITIEVDGYPFKNRTIYLREHDDRNVLTVDSVKSNTVKHIGSIGADLFQDKVLIIDYLNEQIAVVEELPSSMTSKATFYDITLDKRGRPVLPLKIKNEERKVMFDTGSSLFQLITSPQNWAMVTSDQVTDSVLVSSFGKQYYIYGAPIDSIYLGNQKLPQAIAYKADEQTNFLRENEIWGITGNAYFWNDVVIVDFANKKFGLTK